ncbi:MAG: UDP-N-acetylmuramate dehydrogenase, partial [Patescibacteria group bacterium]|nr:UDP-N-acetylmuramate dehydrogenase [Patescibacteria group bacterium]
LAPYTTFRIGGPARFFVQVNNIEELREAVAFAQEKNLKTFVLGGGSNVLFDDAGFEGLVIKVEIRGVEEQNPPAGGFIAGAGESWDKLVLRAVEKNLWGIENLSGIPGSVGGAVVQNIGAYGQALSQTLLWVDVYDTTAGKERRLTAQECESGYRDSIFKHKPGHYIVLRVALKLSSTGIPNTSYKDLAARFGDKIPSSREMREAVLDIRANKFPDLRHEGTAGSFFKNPIVPEAQAHALQARYPELPLFPLPESNEIKVPLGWFLDFRHGVLDIRDIKVGGARMYEKQFLVLVAERDSSSRDVKKLAALVQEKVHVTLGIEIEPEVTIV